MMIDTDGSRGRKLRAHKHEGWRWSKRKKEGRREGEKGQIH